MKKMMTSTNMKKVENENKDVNKAKAKEVRDNYEVEVYTGEG